MAVEKELWRCIKCRKVKLHCAKGLCKECYKKQRPKMVVCKQCNKKKRRYDRGLCKICYKEYAPKIRCKQCGKSKIHAARGLCASCYQKQLIKAIITCIACGKEKPHESKGMCIACYKRCKTYKITAEELNKLYQDNPVCALCKKPFTNDRNYLCALDHNHKTGTIRGLIHNSCNLLLGRVNDDIVLLTQAIEYLKKYNTD